MERGVPTEKRGGARRVVLYGVDFGIFWRGMYQAGRAWVSRGGKLRVGTYIVVAGTVSLGGGVLEGLRCELPELWQRVESTWSWFGFLSCAATEMLLDTDTSSGL